MLYCAVTVTFIVPQNALVPKLIFAVALAIALLQFRLNGILTYWPCLNVPLTSNLASGVVVPIPTLPLEAIANLVPYPPLDVLV